MQDPHERTSSYSYSNILLLCRKDRECVSSGSESFMVTCSIVDACLHTVVETGIDGALVSLFWYHGTIQNTRRYIWQHVEEDTRVMTSKEGSNLNHCAFLRSECCEIHPLRRVVCPRLIPSRPVLFLASPFPRSIPSFSSFLQCTLWLSISSSVTRANIRHRRIDSHLSSTLVKYRLERTRDGLLLSDARIRHTLTVVNRSEVPQHAAKVRIGSATGRKSRVTYLSHCRCETFELEQETTIWYVLLFDWLMRGCDSG